MTVKRSKRGAKLRTNQPLGNDAPVLAPSSMYALIEIEAGRLRTSSALVVWHKGMWRLRVLNLSDAVGYVLHKRWIVRTNVLRGSAVFKFKYGADQKIR